MDKEQTKALFDLGKYASVVYAGALEESGSVETAKEVTFQFLKATLKPDTPPKFFM